MLKDDLGSKIAFDNADFELIESHTEDMQLHKVAVNYHTTELILVDFMGDYLLLAKQPQGAGEPVNTFVVRMQPGLSIARYLEINRLVVNNENKLEEASMRLIV